MACLIKAEIVTPEIDSHPRGDTEQQPPNRESSGMATGRPETDRAGRLDQHPQQKYGKGLRPGGGTGSWSWGPRGVLLGMGLASVRE